MQMSMQVTADPATVPSSFEEAYRDHAQTVARWARRLGGSEIDVEDVVQEVFLVVSRRLSGFRGEARFTSWLFEITRKIVANHRRRQRWRFWRSGNQLENQRSLDRALSPALDPAAELERQQTIAFFYRALDHLPEKYRTVLVLYEIEGMSTQAIADLCHLNLSTVKVQLARARARFLMHYQQFVLGKGSRQGRLDLRLDLRQASAAGPDSPAIRQKEEES
jgi:RNA polymerase sigma-70 factor (ECF subfamily)